MISLYDRVNYKKQLVDKSKNYLDFDVLEDQYKRFSKGFFKGSIADNDKIILYVSKAYSDLTRLLQEHSGRIEMPRNIVLGETVSNMADEMEKDPNNYLVYISTLLSMGDGVLTINELKERVARLYALSEFSEEPSSEVRKDKISALYAASGVLTELIEENNGVIKNPDEIRKVESKTFYAKSDSLDELTSEDRELYDKINKAKIRAISNFLPLILIRPEKGIITADSIQNEYNRIMKLGIFGPNMDFESKIEFEKIYAATQYTLLEKGGAIEYNNRGSILMNFSKNISKVEDQAKISAILSSRDSFSEDSLAEAFEKVLDIDESDKIKAVETTIDFQIAYCAVINEIKSRGGDCSSREAKAAYKRALDSIEKYRLEYRKQTRSPFLIFPKDEKGKEDNIYLNLLLDTATNIEENATTNNLDWLCELVGRQKAIKELYDVVKNPIKRRELDDVKYDVNVSEAINGLEVCDIQYIRNASPEAMITLSNSAGDEIEVSETGKLGYATLRQNTGQPTFSDSMTVKEYEIKKTYLSEQEKGHDPVVKKFKVFSPMIDVDAISSDDRLKTIFADQIFSDMSLEAALETNGGAIASAEYTKNGQKTKPQIYFDENMVGACRMMTQMLEEYSEAEEKKGVKRYLAKKLRNGALVGNSNIQLSRGFASKIMGHVNGDTSDKDTLVAFEWSDIEKKRTIFDLIARSRMQDKR